MRRRDAGSAGVRRRDFIKTLTKVSVGAALSGSLIESPDLGGGGAGGEPVGGAAPRG